MSQIHPQARTTPLTRAEIHHSSEPLSVLMQRYNISKDTARKWKNRPDHQDRSHRAHTLATTLSAAQEVIVLELRRLCLIPLDDLTYLTKRFINPEASRSGINRLLCREGLSNLKELMASLTDEATPKPKTFKDYEPGFIHVDIKYLPQMPDETSRRYLFVAIDRATRWVFFHIYDNQSEQSSADFLHRLLEAAPMKISKVLTDNGTQFTDRFTSKAKCETGDHLFDRHCKAHGIEHRLIKPRHPQTNGMVERFNGRISEVVKQTRFESAAQLQSTLANYLLAYNHHIPQKALGHCSPVEALQQWQAKRPELFVKRVYKRAEPDI
jgi:transposase InsO family protein